MTDSAPSEFVRFQAPDPTPAPRHQLQIQDVEQEGHLLGIKAVCVCGWGVNLPPSAGRGDLARLAYADHPRYRPEWRP